MLCDAVVQLLLRVSTSTSV